MITKQLRNQIEQALPGISRIEKGEQRDTIRLTTAHVLADEIDDLQDIAGVKLQGIYGIDFGVVIVLNVEYAQTPLFDPAADSTSGETLSTGGVTEAAIATPVAR